MAEIRVCVQCQKEYVANDERGGVVPRKYCSPQCRIKRGNEVRRQRTAAERAGQGLCPCGQQFDMVDRHGKKTGRKRYCSAHCRTFYNHAGNIPYQSGSAEDRDRTLAAKLTKDCLSNVMMVALYDAQDFGRMFDAVYETMIRSAIRLEALRANCLDQDLSEEED